MNIPTKVIILFSATLYLTACNRIEQNATTSNDVTVPSEVKIDVSQNSEKSVDAAQPYQKPGAALRLLTTEALQIARDESKEVTFTFVSPATSGSLIIRVKPSEGLVVNNLQPEYTFELPMQTVELPLFIQGLVDGEQTLRFVAELQGKARSMGVVVWVGDLSAKEAAAQQKINMQKENPKIISLPAIETIQPSE